MTAEQYGRSIAIAPDAGLIGSFEHTAWPEMIFIAMSRLARDAIETGKRLRAESGLELGRITFQYVAPGEDDGYWRGDIDPTYTVIAWKADAE